MIGKCPRIRSKSLNIASIQHTRSHTPEKTNFKIAATEMIALTKTREDARIPLRTRNRLAHDASMAHRKPIGGPSMKNLLMRLLLFSFRLLLLLLKKRT
jgi:hypothetical protein